MRTPSAAGALVWSFASTAVSKFGTFAIGIVLARLLGPSEFGAYAVALVALTIVLSFNELGVSLAIVRWPTDPKEIAGTVTTISVGTSVLIYLGGFLGAPLFAAAMGAPGATGTIRLLLVSVVIDALTATPAALLQRDFRSDKRALADQLNTWVGAGISVAMAALGFGAISLAVGRVAGSGLAASILIAISPLRLRFELKRQRAIELLRFGLPLAGASIVVIAAGNIDQLVVGHLLGATALGFFTLAFNISSWPVTMFSQPMRSVAPAAFARMRETDVERTGSFRAIMRVLMVAALPVCGFLAGGSSSIIRFVYGSEWARAAGVLRWLAVLAALRIVFELAYDYLVVVGRGNAVFGLQGLWFATLLPAVVIGARLGDLQGAAISEVIVAVVIVCPVYLALLSRSGIPASLIGRSMVVPLLGATVVGAVSFLASQGQLPALPAAVVGGLTACVMVAVLGWLERGSLRDIRLVRAGVATA